MNRVVIIHENSKIARQLEMQINSIPDYMCTATFENSFSFLTENIFCDFVICSVSLNEITFLGRIMKKLPTVNIILFPEKLQSTIIFKALQIGIVGLVDPTINEVDFKIIFDSIQREGAYLSPKIALKVINYFNSGNNVKVSLTKRETEIVAGILDGLPYKLIADKHKISINTVRMNIKNIYKKLNINSKSELFLKMGYTNYFE